jgi:hypothetical protein
LVVGFWSGRAADFFGDGGEGGFEGNGAGGFFEDGDDAKVLEAVHVLGRDGVGQNAGRKGAEGFVLANPLEKVEGGIDSEAEFGNDGIGWRVFGGIAVNAGF